MVDGAALARRILILVMFSLAWHLPAPATPTYANAETGPLVAQVRTPDYRLTDEGVEVPGYALHSVPGAPSLPLRGFTFELPLTGEWELTFESTDSRILSERVSVAAAPVPDLDLNGPVAPQDQETWPTSVPVVDRPDPSIYTVDAFYPASPVLAGEPVRHGNQRILPVRVFPFQYNPVTRQLRYHPDLLVRIQVQRGGEGPTPAAPLAGDFYDPTVLPGDGVLRIHTNERGLYRLTYDELSAAGVPVGPGGTHPDTFAVYHKGQQIDIQVTGAGDGSFDQGDLVIFYAVPYDGGRFQNYNVYQFVYGSEVVAQRIATRAVMATTIPTTTSVITQTLHVEVDRDYRSLYPRASYEDHFFDTQLYVNATTPALTRSYDLALSNPITATDKIVQITALIHGGANQAANPDQSVLLRLNSHDIDDYQWEGRVDHLVSASVPAVWLDGTPNQVHLVADLAQLPSLSYYWISPDWVQISYPARAIAASDYLYIEGLVSPINAVSASGFTSPFVSVFDVRDPSHPLLLSGVGVQLDGGSYLLHWDETVAAPTYALSTADALLTPGAIERDIPSNWANPNNAYDYVAIVGAERSYSGTTPLGSQLATALQPLLAHRTADGFDVALVKVQDIYDEWSYGRIDPMAIRSFLSYAYHNWATPPGYVLLVGDGHYDYNKVTTQPLPMLVPPYLADVDPWWGEVPTDNLYVSVDSLSDYLPDMAVGRMPVNTAAETTAVATKILTYESIASNPAGPWQQRAVYVAGDCADPAGNFHALSNQGRLSLPAPYVNNRIYFDGPTTPTLCTDGTQTDAAAMRAAIRQAFTGGSFYLQWFGHGSQSSWGGGGTFFAVNDLFQQLVGPTTQLPFTTANACLTGYFVWNSSFASRQSLAELLVSTPERGSIVDLSPSGLHIGSALLTLQQGMHKKLFEERIERAGDVVDATKLFFFQNSVGWHDVIDTMILFGDPALKLRYPIGDLSSSTLDVSAAEAPLGATLSYTLTVRNSSVFTTSQPLVVVDYPQNLATVVDGGGAVDNGDTLSWTLSDLPPNSQQVVTFSLNASAAPLIEGFDLIVPATVSSQMAPDVALEVQTLILTAPDAVVSSLEANRAWLPPGFSLTATLTLSHNGDLPAPGVLVTMTLPAELGAPTRLSTSSLLYDPLAHRLTWSGDAPAGAPTTLAFSSTISPSLAACGILAVDAIVFYNGSNTPQTTVVNLVTPDVNCSGSVTVADIQQVAARWGSQAGDAIYHPRFDLNADDVIDILDITAAAQRWD